MGVSVPHPADAATRRAVQVAEVRFSGMRRAALLLGSAVGAVGAVMVVGSAAGAEGASLGDGLGWLSVGAFWLAVAFMRPEWLAWLGVRDPRFREPALRTLDEDGLHLRGETLAYDLPWSRVVRVRETERFVLLYADPGVGHHLDKSLMSMDEISEVRRLVRTHQVKRRRLFGLLPPART